VDSGGPFRGSSHGTTISISPKNRSRLVDVFVGACSSSPNPSCLLAIIPVRAVPWWWSEPVRPASRLPRPSSSDDPVLDLEAPPPPLAAVIWCTGYRSVFRWIDGPVFDGSGQPAHDRGVTQSPGLDFLGLPWLHTWGSGRFCGVADDAEYLAALISLRLARRDASQERLECTALLGS